MTDLASLLKAMCETDVSRARASVEYGEDRTFLLVGATNDEALTHRERLRAYRGSAKISLDGGATWREISSDACIELVHPPARTETRSGYSFSFDAKPMTLGDLLPPARGVWAATCSPRSIRRSLKRERRLAERLRRREVWP